MPKQDTQPHAVALWDAKLQSYTRPIEYADDATNIDTVPYWHRDSLGDWHTHPLGTESHDHFHPATSRADHSAGRREWGLLAGHLPLILLVATAVVWAFVLGLWYGGR